MQYQELELGSAKQAAPINVSKRCSTYQVAINSVFLLVIVGLAFAYLHMCLQLRSIRWELNATHHHIDELQARISDQSRHRNGDAESSYEYLYDEPFPEFYSRMKREIIAETTDGVPIDTRSYVEAKRRNQTKKAKHTLMSKAEFKHSAVQPESTAWPQHEEHEAKFRHYDDLVRKTTPTTREIHSRPSRVMHTEDTSAEHKIQTKSLPSNRPHTSQQLSGEIQVSSKRRRPHKLRLVESFEDELQGPTTILKPSKRVIPAAHLSGDTSKYVLGFHTNYKGNGHMKHLDKTYVDWTPSNWMEKSNSMDAFSYKQGVLTVNENGLYFIYAQIYYLDEHDMNGYRVYRNDEAILQCTTMTHSTSRITKGNTCYTAGVEYLEDGDRITVRDLSDERYSLFEKGKSFFGAFKLNDIRIK